jgi:hypothetical protein
MENKPRHPLEEVFNMDGNNVELDIENQYGVIQPENLPVPTQEAMEQAVPPDVKDDDDIATDKKIDAVYDAAITTFNNQTAYTEIIEPRYAARNAEVAAQYLNIALSAATAKAKVKADRKRTNAAFIPFNNGNRTGNNIVADRNAILDMIIDTDVKQIK